MDKILCLYKRKKSCTAFRIEIHRIRYIPMSFPRLRIFFLRHHTVLIAIGLALVFFCVQCAFINDYGVTWDEPLHRNWGKLFAAFLKTGDRRLLELMPGHGVYYGPLYYYVNYLLSEWLYNAHLLFFVASNHILNLLTAGIAVGFVFLLGDRIGGRRIGLLATLFFVFFPPFVAHSHYNPKDIPLMTAVLVSCYMFVCALEKKKRWLFLLTGFLLGVSIAFKISALLMVPVFAFSYGVSIFSAKKGTMTIPQWKREAITVVLIVLSILLGTYLAWPSAWGEPGLILRSIRFFQADFWPGQVLYFGTNYSGGALPWYYTPFEYLMVMPLLLTLSLLAGALVLVKALRSGRHSALNIFLLLWIFVPLLVSLKPGLVRYDGMRQFFFCLPAIAVIAAIGFDRFLQWIVSRIGRAVLSVNLCLGILCLSLVHEVAILHPFEGSYRNEIVRMFIPANMDRSFQIEYWGATYKQGMDWLRDNAEPDPVICVPTAGILVTWYPWRADFTFECSERSNYVMFFTRYTELQKYDSLTATPLFTLQRMHSDLLKIYAIGGKATP